jgi:hypothetical protein
MPRSDPGTTTSTLGRSRDSLLSRRFNGGVTSLWHAACIVAVLQGCVILKGPWTLRQNSPPEEFMVSPKDQILLDTEVQSVLVGFRDEDADPLFFTWIIDGRVADPSDIATFVDVNDPLLYFSTFRARRAQLETASQVSVIVTDGEDAVRVTWQVVNP